MLIHAVLKDSAPAAPSAATGTEEPSPPQKRRKTEVQHTPAQTPPTDVWRGKYITFTEVQGDNVVYRLNHVKKDTPPFGLMFPVMDSLGYFQDVADGTGRCQFEGPGRTNIVAHTV